MTARIAVFCAFDGSVCTCDIVEGFFKEFGDKRGEDALTEWRAGLLTGRQAVEEACRGLTVEPERLRSWLAGLDLDPYFRDFIDFSFSRDIDVSIVSEGLDLCIHELLGRNGLRHLPVFANRAEWRGEALNCEFPYHDRLDCRECGNCKTWHLRAKSEQGYFTVYIGEGSIDRCPCEHADMVFAKGELRDYCLNHGIRHFRYNNFRDVEMILTEKLRQRQIA